MMLAKTHCREFDISNYKYIKQAIREHSRDDFARLVADLFTPFLPSLFSTHRLGELDGLGSDLIDFSDSGEVLLTIQCKGFEKPNFGDAQLGQCLAEIEKYAAKGLPTRRYWLALNRAVVTSADRKAIETALAALVSSAKAGEAKLLDFNWLVRELEQTALTCLHRWAHDHQVRSAADHRANLAVVDYIAGVPFRTSDTDGSDPSSYFASRVLAERDNRPTTQFGKDRKPPRLMLKGSFGFGKTSCLLATTSHLAEKQIYPIYVRAADLKEAAFVSGHGLLVAILETFIPEDANLSKLAFSLAVDTLREELKSSDRWALLIDAIDESAYSSQSSRLSALWGGVIDAGLPVLVSVRSELADQRQSEFGINPKTLAHDLFEAISLEPWTDPLIGSFLTSFASRQQGDASDEFVEFRSLVASGKYESVYGDIPRRPLFLGMLAADAWHGRASPQQLSDLYEHYFARKFERDRYESGHQRPFGLLDREGMDEALRLIFLAMESAAAALNEKAIGVLVGGSNDVTNVGSLTRGELNSALQKSGLGDVVTTELSAHSVIVPGGRDRSTGEPLFRFAHASFEDYFLARWLWRNHVAPDDTANDAVRRFHAEMATSRLARAD